MTQIDFSGGMNLFDDPLVIGQNQYGLAYNVRNRASGLNPVKFPVEDTTAPAGKKQGIFAFDNYIIIFVAGKAYYKHIVNDTAWTQVTGLQLSATPNYIYAEAVPASSFNFERKLKESTQIVGNTTDTAMEVTTVAINGSKAGLIVQDGVNQGYIINDQGVARKLATYAEWTMGAKEYVPVMRQMKYLDGRLYGISKDGKKIYHSVSGRPLDFVVNVNTAGEKGGDADSIAYAFTYKEINCLASIGGNRLFIATNDSSHPLDIDYTRTRFAEPYLLNLAPFAAGVVNQHSFINILREDGLSDFYFIDTDGLRTFNAASNSQNEGRNLNFSLNISNALVAKQSVTAAIVFDNYSLFSIKTIYNDTRNFIAVFDNNRQQWVSFDDFSISSIKQFAVADQGTNPTLYGITEDKVYRFFATETYQPNVYFRSEFSGDASISVKLNTLRVAMLNSSSTGIVTAYEILNGNSNAQIHERLGALAVQNLALNFKYQAKQGFSIQPRLSWNTNAKLQLLQTDIEGIQKETNVQQQAKLYS